MIVPTPPTPPDVPRRAVTEMNRLQEATGSADVALRPPTASTVELAQRLFDNPRRWGWEYAEPTPPQPYPHLNGYPRWVEPPPPDVGRHQYALRAARAALPKLLGIGGALTLLGLMFLGGTTSSFGAILLLAGLGVAGWGIARVAMARSAIRQAEEAAARSRAALHGQFLDMQRRWDEQIARHDAEERYRCATEPLLFPVRPGGLSGRVDVFGGSPDGWAALLATMGSSALASGDTMLVLDLTRHDLAGPLAELSRAVGTPVQTAAVPAALEAPWLLGDLPPRELADVLAAAIDAMRGKQDNADLAAMDAEVVHEVSKRLERPLTFDRLAAGVRVLRATFDPDDEGDVLSAVEVQRLTARVDLIDRSERLRDEMRFVEAQLSILADSERAAEGSAGAAGSLWLDRGLAVLRNDEKDRRRHKFVDQVLVQAVERHLGTGGAGGSSLLVVAGADDLGRAALEALADAAYQAQVRLVFLFQHLREDTADVLGGGDSAVLFMQLQNAREAQAAAEHIGRGHTFQLGQLSRQVGTNSSVARNRSTTVTETESETLGTSGSVTNSRGGSSSFSSGGSHSGGLFGFGGTSSSNWGRSSGTTWGESVTEGWSESVTRGWSTAVTEGTTVTEGTSDTEGVVVQRSYEFKVEPTTLQELDRTAFLLVDRGPEGRRVRIADCFPGAALMPRISPAPRG